MRKRIVGALLLLGGLGGCCLLSLGEDPVAVAARDGDPTTCPSCVDTRPSERLSAKQRLAVARRFAPRLRFNGFFDDGNPSAQNRHEDFFPMSVGTFLTQLEQGRVQVLITPAKGDARGISAGLKFEPGEARFETGFFGPYPKLMVGDPPGKAPLYVHVYDGKEPPKELPGGGRELTAVVEYWLFYPGDRADVALFGRVTSGENDLFGHRGDWEHVTYKVRVQIGADGRLKGGELEEGYYYGHGFGFLVAKDELERVDDAGNPSPNGTHPVVYVAQGKHASYPQAGHWTQVPLPVWVAEHTDFFRGNGVVVDTWGGRFVDLLDPAGHPGEFANPAWTAIQARSPQKLPDWSRYHGRWGPDGKLVVIGTTEVALGLSPTGPRVKSSWHDHGATATTRWSDAKRDYGPLGLKVYADEGITIPPIDPPPVPVRR